MEDEQRERRGSRFSIVIAVAACLLLLAALTPSPYVIERPGPVVDTLGEVVLEDGEDPVPVISIDGAETYETDGVLNLLTVSIFGNPEHRRSWLSLLPGLVDPSQHIAPISDFYPEGVTVDDRTAANEIQMASSQSQAAAAAFESLGEPVTVDLRVVQVVPNGPSTGVLEAEDRLVAVNGTPIDDYTGLRGAITGSGADEPLVVGVIRDGEARDVTITPRVPDGGGDPLIGATVSSTYELPAEIDVSLSEIGGPSAGLVFALAVVDRLTPDDLLSGLTVSGTGTMSDRGDVGAIGGLTQKMWAAQRANTDLFLMPLANCADVPERVPEGLRIAPVATLDEARAAVEATVSGDEPAGIERCEKVASLD